MRGNTYAYGRGLSEEANEIKVQLATGGKRDTAGDHKNYNGQLPIGLLDAESPGYNEDRNWRKCLLENGNVRKGEGGRKGGSNDMP